jgi:elongator complex protein 1
LGETTPEGWAARMKEYERQKRIDPMEKIGRPDVAKEGMGRRMSEV